MLNPLHIDPYSGLKEVKTLRPPIVPIDLVLGSKKIEVEFDNTR
jgi:hypothetical protein